MTTEAQTNEAGNSTNGTGREPEEKWRRLRAAYDALKAEEPRLRARDAARRLGVSEGELLSSRCGDGVVRLDGPWKDVIHRLPALGRVLALTRNEHVVHEKKGVFGEISFSGPMGLVLNQEIDLRLFMTHWQSGFAVREEVASGVRDSLQFFDGAGDAVQKIYLLEDSDRAAYDALVGDFRSADQKLGLALKPAAPADEEKPDSQIDGEGFRDAWRALRDVHDFFGMLRKYKVTRLQGMRLASGEFTHQVAPDAARFLLEQAAARNIPIMCFVGNKGCIQIHTGPVETIKPMGPWINVLDPDFNLHLREDAVASAWVVRKPTEDGIVTSVELYDADGFCFVQFFGERKPGKPELAGWRALVDDLPGLKVRADAAD